MLVVETFSSFFLTRNFVGIPRIPVLLLKYFEVGRFLPN